MHASRSQPSRLALLLSLAVLPVSALPAAEEVLEMEKFEVTAQQRTQPITEVPLSVTAYNGSALSSLGVSEYKDLAPFVPGLFIQEQSPNNPGINIRGVTTDSGDPRSETRVSIFQDGISISRSRGSVVELFDMERVEVLKGPQGTLFGRGAEIGALSLIQNKAVNENSSELTLASGNYNAKKLSGYANVTLAPGELYGRFAFSLSSHDGTVQNIADNSTLNGKKTFAYRPSLHWQPTANTSLDLIFNYQHDNPPGTDFKSGSIAPHNGDTSPYTFAELNRGGNLKIDRTVWGGTALLTQKCGDELTLTSITGARYYDSMEQFDADGSYLDLLEFAEDARGHQFSQEFRLNYDNKEHLSGFVGASFFHEKGSQRVPFYADERALWPFLASTFRSSLISAGVPSTLAYAAVPQMNPLQPQDSLPAGFAYFATPGLPASLQALAALANAPLNGVNPEEYINTGETRATELFADGTYHLTSNLSLSAGLRMTHEHDISGYQVINAAKASHIGFLEGAGQNVLFAPTNGLRLADMNQTGWSGRLVADYKLNSSLGSYVSFSRGRRPGSLIVTASSVTKLHEETVDNEEAGVKGLLLNKRLQWNAAVFRYTYNHFQTSVADSSNLGRFVDSDAGKASGRGFELALQGSLSSWLTVFSSYGYTDATFNDYGNNGQKEQYAGNHFRLTARHTASLGTQLLLPCGDKGSLFLTPVMQYKSHHFFEDNNALFNYGLSQGGFTLFNLRAGWYSPSRRWQIEAYADNLFDKKYLIDAGNTGENLGIPTYIPGSPLMYGVSVTRRF